jgi:Na+/pantothenate symporter
MYMMAFMLMLSCMAAQASDLCSKATAKSTSVLSDRLVESRGHSTGTKSAEVKQLKNSSVAELGMLLFRVKLFGRNLVTWINDVNHDSRAL